jgi:pimeloyl-ACP methyl ester carboxylesterase
VNEPYPQTRYVTVGDADVAYQVLGESPRDLLVFNGLGSNIEVAWLLPEVSEFLTRLASFSRLITFDRRGVGASDALARNAIPTWEDFTEDAAAVLDAVGSQQTAILAVRESGPMALLFAAMHPERVGALILLNTYARTLVADDYAIGLTPEDVDAIVELVKAQWGTPGLQRLVYPSRADDLAFLDRAGRVARSSTTPRMAAAQLDYILRHVDVRQTLPFIHVPTLVLHTRESNFIPPAQGRYLAEHINGARFVELPGSDLTPWGENTVRIAEEIAEFLTGERPGEVERLLTTVLFTDMSIQPVVRQRLAIAPGTLSSMLTTEQCETNCDASAARKSTPLETASWPASTVRPGPFAAPVPSAKPPTTWASTSVSDSTRVSARFAATTSAGLRFISPPGWRRWPVPATSWCPPRSRISSWARASSSRTEENTS